MVPYLIAKCMRQAGIVTNPASAGASGIGIVDATYGGLLQLGRTCQGHIVGQQMVSIVVAPI